MMNCDVISVSRSKDLRVNFRVLLHVKTSCVRVLLFLLPLEPEGVKHTLAKRNVCPSVFV